MEFVFLYSEFQEPVYTQLDVLDYVYRKDGQKSSKSNFFNNPNEYLSKFSKFTNVADIYIAGHFHAKDSPPFFTKKEAKSEGFKIKVVADISCDINGPIACTIRPSTIEDPLYGYNPKMEKEVDFQDLNAIAVMAVDNLPCELPRDSSEGFAESFIKKILPSFFNGDKDGILKRSKMTENGSLTTNFMYLQKYVDY